MRLVNTATRADYEMEKVKDETVSLGIGRLNQLEQTLKWTTQTRVYEAVLLGKPIVRVVRSDDAGILALKDCRLAFNLDGKEVVCGLPLLGPHDPIPPVESLSWFIGMEGDEKKGIFIPNGADLSAVVTAAKVPESLPEFEILLEIQLYTASARTVQPG